MACAVWRPSRVGCGHSSHYPPTQIHRSPHPGLLQRPRSVRRRGGQGSRQRDQGQGAWAGAHRAGAVPSRGRGGGHGTKLFGGDAQPPLRPQRGLEPRRKRRPSRAKCPPLAGPELGSGASPGRTRRLWTARCSQGARPALWAPSHCLGGSSDPPPQSPIPPPFEHSGCLVVRALRPIRCGEELCLSYVETSLTTAERKAHLLSHFGFECDCARCTTE